MTAALLWTLAVLLIAAGLAGLVLPALPGPVLLFAGFVVGAWAEDFRYIGFETLGVLGVLAVVAYVVDFAAGSLGASRYGASRYAAIGAAIGAVVGIFLGPIGILLGPFAGAVLGELLANKGLYAASRAGFGATLGMLLGTAAKLALGFTMLGLFVLMRFV
ncbi:MAG TPA: DUF456 domain-containing protein [Gammaproteobacteria bacterium]